MYDGPTRQEEWEAILIGLVLLGVVLALSLLSMGCASCPPCVPETEVVEVPVEVPVNPCAGLVVPPPPEPPPDLPPDATPQQMGERIQRWIVAVEAWAVEVAELARGCVQEEVE